MELGAILLIGALAVAVAAFVAEPVVKSRGVYAAAFDKRVSELQAERDRALAMLQELEMDRSLGKVTDEDYGVQRQLMVQRGADALRELDQLTPPDSLDKELEAAIAEARRGPSGETCPNCSSPVVAGDRFCANCGEALEV